MHKDVNKFKIAASLFQLDRNIALGPAYFYLLNHKATEEALYFINKGITYDPNAADLLAAKMQYSFTLGKNDDVVRAFNRLALIAPNSSIVKELSKKH